MKNDGLDLRRHPQASGDKDHLKVFADQDAARQWFGEHDGESVAFEYPVMKEA